MNAQEGTQPPQGEPQAIAPDPGSTPLCESCGKPKNRVFRGYGGDNYWACLACKSARAKEHYAHMRASKPLAGAAAAQALAEQAKPPKPERPLSPCWREHRDYWAAAAHLGLREIR